MAMNIFSWLSESLVQNTGIALSASFIWGVLSIILSPCHLASIPLIVGFIDDQGRITAKRAFKISFLFSLGILVSICSIGMVTVFMGRMAGDVGKWGNYTVAAIFFLVGLYLFEAIPLSFSGPGQAIIKKKGPFASFILGLIFGIALGPCTFAYMAPVIGVAFTSAKTNVLYAGFLLLAYAAGHCSVIVLAGTFTEVLQRYLNWTERSRGAVMIKKICGILVILGGVYLIVTAKG
ncbi:MAG: cytochrome c biogenesis protein CcdA [Candidatus Omnitrophota bacterium]